MKRFVIALAIALTAAGAAAKPPPLTPEQQAAAAAAAAKTAWDNKVAAYQLCQAETRVAEGYIKQQKAQGKVYTPAATAPCVDPGPYVAPVAAAPAAVAQAAPAAAAQAAAPAAGAKAPATAAPAAPPAAAPAPAKK